MSDDTQQHDPLPASDKNLAAARAFALAKWRERAAERGEPEPPDLSRACKFASLFAAQVFGGEVQGNFFHQWSATTDGEIVDLCVQAQDVCDLVAGRVPGYAQAYAKAAGRRVPEELYSHDADFMESAESLESMDSVRPRVDAWAREFLAQQRPTLQHAGLAWPLALHDRLSHVGSLDPAHKGATHNTTSLEGAGLSVSVHPDEWKAIARLGGNPTWELAPPHGAPAFRLLDAHRLTAAHWDCVMTWAREQGYVTETSVIEVSWYDSEREERVAMQFDGDDPVEAVKAKSEYEFLIENEGGSESEARPLAQGEIALDRWIEKRDLPEGVADVVLAACDDETLYVHNFEIEASMQGQGLGAAAFYELLDDANRSGIRRIEIDSLLSAVEFWERMGFECNGSVDDGYQPMAMDTRRYVPSLQGRRGFKAAPAMHDRIGFEVNLASVGDLALTLYVEDVLASADEGLALHGTWWEDALDPMNLSAPRGALLAAIVPHCGREIVEEADRPLRRRAGPRA